MFGRVFRYQGWLWRALNTLTDILALSVLWLLCSIPVLTLGAATTALYDSVVRCIRYKMPRPYERFFRTFKNEIVPGALLTLLWGAVAALGLWMLALLRQYSAESPSAGAAGAAYYVALVLPLGAACWVFPILSRCELGFGALNKTALYCRSSVSIHSPSAAAAPHRSVSSMPGMSSFLKVRKKRA